MNLYIAACKAANIAYVFEVVWEDHDRERAGHLVFAEIEEADAFAPHRDAAHLSTHALGFPNVSAGLLDWQAICHGKGWDGREDYQDDCNCVCPHTLILWLRERIHL